MEKDADDKSCGHSSNMKDAEQGELSFPEYVWTSVTNCLDNAERLLLAASKLQDEGIFNVAYHLAGLALEETGKADMITADFCASQRPRERSWIDRQSCDHIRKLFWALWGPSFGRQLITAEQLASFEGLAKHIHNTRLRGLYFDPSGEQDILPKDAVTEAEAANLVSLARTTLEMARLGGPRVLTEEEKADLRWFNDATTDPEKRRLIMAQNSMAKLVELGSAGAWIHWLRLDFERAEAERRARTELELNRPEPSEEEAWEAKWRLRIRLHTSSHSIRPRTLNVWNGMCNWIKVSAVDGKKQQVLVDLTLPKVVLASGVWWAGWGAARKFVTALNIGSMGFFWWYVPEQISRYYEKLTDVEGNSEFGIDRSPILKLDWHRDALSEQELRDTGVCFAMLPGPDEKDKHEPFDHYLTGLGFLSKTDVHMQFEANAYESFYLALKKGMHVYGDWDGNEPFSDAFDRLASDFISDPAARGNIVRLGESFTTGQPALGEMTLSEVGTLKVLCDFYFLLTFRRLMQERTREGDRS